MLVKIVAQDHRVDAAVDQLVKIRADPHVRRAEFLCLTYLAFVLVADSRDVRLVDFCQGLDKRQAAPDAEYADFKLLFHIPVSSY